MMTEAHKVPYHSRSSKNAARLKKNSDAIAAAPAPAAKIIDLKIRSSRLLTSRNRLFTGGVLVRGCDRYEAGCRSVGSVICARLRPGKSQARGRGQGS